MQQIMMFPTFVHAALHMRATEILHSQIRMLSLFLKRANLDEYLGCAQLQTRCTIIRLRAQPVPPGEEMADDAT